MPGVRTHLGANWYLLGGVEVPVTSPKALDFQVLGGADEGLLNAGVPPQRLQNIERQDWTLGL
jgi:hypothetical protein